MSTFSLGNLHFLDDINDIEQFSLSEKNTPTAVGQINQNEKVNSTTILITNTVETKNDDHFNNSTSSSSVEVEFDENLNVLNEFETASEPNSLRTTDYSENQIDPNLPYQSVFTLNTSRTIQNTVQNTVQSAEHSEEHIKITKTKEVQLKEDEKVISKEDYFNFDFDETTFKPRPYRPKSATKRQTSNKTDEKKLNPITNKKSSLLTHSFWAEIEQEALQNDEKSSSDEANKDNPTIKDKEIIRDKEMIEDDKDDLYEDDLKDELNDDLKDELNDEIEKSESLSSEKEMNNDDLKSSKNLLQVNESLNSQDDDSNKSSNNNSLNGENELQINASLINELKSHINQLYNPGDKDKIIDELNDLKQILEQSNINQKLEQFKTELINEFNEMLMVNELKLPKERNRLEYSEFRLQFQNLEQHFDKQIKNLGQNLVDFFNKSIKDQRTEYDQKQLEQLSRLINDLEKIKVTSSTDQTNKITNDLTSKLNFDKLSDQIENLNNKIDLILNKKVNKTKSIFSSDEESNDDELIKRNQNSKDKIIDTKLDEKLDEIKSLLNEMSNNQKANLEMPDLTIKEDNQIILNSDESKEMKESPLKDELTSEKCLSKLELDDQTCDLCELADRISSNIRSFRNTFYRQKINAYSKCRYTTNFINKLDHQIKLGDLNREHDHNLNNLNGQTTINNDLENRLNLRIKSFIRQAGDEVRDSFKQLRQLGDYDFVNEINHSKFDDIYRLKQIQSMRFKINRRLIKLNQMIVNHY